MNEQVRQVMLDLVETARDDNYNMDVTLNRFPELQQVDKQLLLDFVQTSRDLDFDMDEAFSLFPEITGVGQEDEEPGKGQDPTIFRGTPVVGLERSDSDGEETKQEDIFLAGSVDDIGAERPELVASEMRRAEGSGSDYRMFNAWNAPLRNASGYMSGAIGPNGERINDETL